MNWQLLQLQRFLEKLAGEYARTASRRAETRAQEVREYLASDEFEKDLEEFARRMKINLRESERLDGEPEVRPERILRKIRFLGGESVRQLGLRARSAVQMGRKFGLPTVGRILGVVTIAGSAFLILYRAGRVFIVKPDKKDLIVIS